MWKKLKTIIPLKPFFVALLWANLLIGSFVFTLSRDLSKVHMPYTVALVVASGIVAASVFVALGTRPISFISGKYAAFFPILNFLLGAAALAVLRQYSNPVPRSWHTHATLVGILGVFILPFYASLPLHLAALAIHRKKPELALSLRSGTNRAVVSIWTFFPVMGLVRFIQTHT